MRFGKLGIAALAALLAFGPHPSRAQEELKIGAIGSLSGGGTAWGLALNRGVTMAFDEVNAAGGLKVGDKTYKVKMVMLDDGYTSAGGRNAADRLINLEKVKFIIGPIGSPPSLGAVSATDPAHILLFSDGFAANILKNDSHAAFNFRNYDTTLEFAPAMVDWLKKNRPDIKKIGLLAPNDAVGQAVVPLLIGFYKAAGYEVMVENFDRGTQEFVPLITRLMSQGMDCFDLNSNSPGDAGLMMKQVRQAGFKGLVWQVGGPSVAEIMQVAGPLAEGFLSLQVFDFDSPEGRKFAETYHKQWSGIINAQAPLWYNTALILMQAMRHAGSLDVEKVRDAMTQIEGYDPGVVGPVVWGGMANYGVNHQLLIPFWITSVKDGQEHIVAKIIPEKK